MRKQECGHEKRKKKRRRDELNKSQIGALDKFIQKEPHVSSNNENIDDDNVNGDGVDDTNVENTDFDDHVDEVNVEC